MLQDVFERSLVERCFGFGGVYTEIDNPHVLRAAHNVCAITPRADYPAVAHAVDVRQSQPIPGDLTRDLKGAVFLGALECCVFVFRQMNGGTGIEAGKVSQIGIDVRGRAAVKACGVAIAKTDQ
ncbi:MAG: hypothetical protein U1E75_02575 [Alicycliphilus sp.]